VDHARRLDALLADGHERRVYLSRSLVDGYIRKARRQWRVFKWRPAQFSFGHLGTVKGTEIFGAPHFSATTYKKTVYEKLGEEVREFCDRFRVNGAG